jgi:hypothetical protein
MKSRVLRTTLLALFVGALGAAAYVVWAGEMDARTQYGAAHVFDARGGAAARAVLELRVAQQGYVATGQGEDYWVSKVIERTTATRDALAAVRTTASAPEAHAAIDEASAAVRAFEQLDRRARDYARSGQKLLASDMIYTEAPARIEAALAALDQARDAETRGRETVVRDIRRRQLAAIAAAGAGGILIMLALVPLPRVEETTDAAPVSEPAGEIGLRLRERPSAPVAAARDPGRMRPPPAGVATLRPVAATAPAAAAPAVDIDALATLCGELARLNDTLALPDVLARAAQLMEASGIVLWIADVDGQELSPIMTHGYAPHLIARLGTLERDAQNVTAAAFRTAQLQTVRGSATSNGALAAPLVRPDGCVGVMAAELRTGEVPEARLAVARIVAAQLATLVGPSSPQRSGQAEVAGA